MIFKLSKEQIEEIIEQYGGTKQTIGIVEKKINLLGVIDNEEDYYEIICSVIAQKETFKLKNENSDFYSDNMKFDQIIEMELNRKYINYDDKKLASIRRSK